MDPQQQEDSLPVTVDALAAAVVLVYQDAEQWLLRRLAALVRAAFAAGPGSFLMTRLHANLKREATRTAASVQAQVPGMAATVSMTAARNGETAAARELARSTVQAAVQPMVPASEAPVPALVGADGTQVPSRPASAGGSASPTTVTPGGDSNVHVILPHDVNSARLIGEDLESRLTAATQRITRVADDAHRAATIAAAVEQILPGKATPQEAQAQAWRQLVSRGVTGFTDKAGREWNLSTYVEMAVRTATQRAYNASHRDRLTQAGIEYFTISTTGRPCGLCAPWEGKVLADRGAGEVTEPHAAADGTVTFDVAATIEEATAAGLFHPNCKHTLTAYLPGVTRLRTNNWSAADELAYRTTQTLRALERDVRAAKLAAEAALTPLDKARAMRDVRAGQARIRDFTARTGLNRRRHREQLNNGLSP